MKYNDVPFAPCNDCSNWESCTQEAYEQGEKDAQEECERCIYSGWKDMPAIKSEAYEKGKIDILKETIQQLKDSDLVTFSQVIVFLGDKVEELEEKKE